MKHGLNTIKKEAEHIVLSHTEKAAMRAAIFGLSGQGAPNAGAAPSPYVFLSFFSYNTRMVLAGLLLVVVAGAGTASAAQRALPGDTLYPIKISINEQVELALASNTAAKATLEVEFAERRVEEAQTLAAAGRLDTDMADSLGATVEVHIEKAEALASEVEPEEPGVAAEVRAKLASSLSANGAVLKRLGRDSSNERSKRGSEVLSAKVIARSDGSGRAEARAFSIAAPAAKSAPSQGGGSISSMTMAVADSSGGEDANPKVAVRLQSKAAEALKEAREEYEERSGPLEASLAAQVTEQFGFADEAMSKGSAALGAGAYAEAQAHFTEVLRISLRLEALLKAEKRFDNGILRELLNGEVEGVSVEVPPMPSIEVELERF